MKTTISQYDFEDAFKKMDRDNNFSYEGKIALFNYLEELEQDTGEEIELDIIALCCDYTEYENLEELKKNYNNIETIEDLRDNTTVIEIDGTDRFIIQNY